MHTFEREVIKTIIMPKDRQGLRNAWQNLSNLCLIAGSLFRYFAFLIFVLNSICTFPCSLVCSCAQRAKAKGYTYFGIQYFGECWSGPGHLSFRKHGTSSACKSAAFQQCNVKAGSRRCLCTGDQHSNYVYKLL